jgi:hypothetical protein
MIERRGQRELERAESGARFERDPPGSEVFAGATDVRAEQRRGAKCGAIAVADDVFLHDDRVGARRHRCSGEDAACRFLCERRRKAPHSAFRGHVERPGPGARKIGKRHGIAVHRARVERGKRRSRDDAPSEHAPSSVTQVDPLGSDRRNVAQHQLLRFVEREHAGRPSTFDWRGGNASFGRRARCISPRSRFDLDGQRRMIQQR